MKPFLFLLLATVSLAACAQGDTSAAAPSATAAAKPAASTAAGTGSADIKVPPGSPAAQARDALRLIKDDIRIESIQDAPFPGFQQAIAGGQVVYVSNDGKYLIQGQAYDMQAKQNLGDAAMAGLRRELLKKMPVGDRIVFSPPNPKYTLTVFTDVECGYCRKLHSEMAQYNKLGIAVQYVAFPRMGLGSADFKKMVAVWCAPDRKQALTNAKQDRAVPYRNCRNPVTQQYSLGKRMGLSGTPMIIASDGTELGGYVPPAKLRAELDEMAAQGVKPPVSGAASSG